MAQTFYKRTVDKLRRIYNLWVTEPASIESEEEATPTYVMMKTEDVIDAAVEVALVILEGAEKLIDKQTELPTLSRKAAARALNVCTKTLREKEDKGELVPMYLDGRPAYQYSDLLEYAHRNGKSLSREEE